MSRYSFSSTFDYFRSSIPMAEARVVKDNETKVPKMNKEEENNNNPIHFLCIDHSGSMEWEACNTTVHKEAKGYTRRDFACQGAMFVVKSLPVGSKICILKFSDSAQIVLEPTVITDDNIQTIFSKILTIYPDLGTNAYSGLCKIKQLIEAYEAERKEAERKEAEGFEEEENKEEENKEEENKEEENKAKKAKVILITDGQDDVLKTNNVVSYLETLKSHNEFPFQIDTVAMGSGADTDLLVKIAQTCGGVYTLCYSAYEVYTVFGHAAARLQLPADEIFCIRHSAEPDKGFYKKARDQFILFKDEIASVLLDEFLSSLVIGPTQEKDMLGLMETLKTWLQKHRSENKASPSVFYDYIKDLLTDVKGELYLAIESKDYWQSWGYSYWRTTGMALQKCYTPNFKDVSLSHFGSKKAEALYKSLDTICDSMPPIPRTGSIHTSVPTANAVPVNFNDRDAGCFHPRSEFQGPDGVIVNVNDILASLKAKDEVWLLGHKNQPVKVEVLIKTYFDTFTHPGVYFCKVGNTMLTVNHPIWQGKWVHPKTLIRPVREKVDFIFNLVLAKDDEGQRYPSVYVNDHLCVCLGHGIQDGSPAEDSFWGSEKVVQEYKRIYPREWALGYIEDANRHMYVFDKIHDHVIGMFDVGGATLDHDDFRKDHHHHHKDDGFKKPACLTNGVDCFHPDSLLTLPNQEKVNVFDLLNLLKANQPVWLLGDHNQPVRVETLVITPLPPNHPGVVFCKVGDTVLTFHHPIWHEQTNQWVYPQSLAPVYCEKVDFVFNLILAKIECPSRFQARFQSVYVNGNLCLCLGHGIEDGSAADDPFWGTEQVINDYKRIYPGQYKRGYIDTVNHEILWDELENFVMGFRKLNLELESCFDDAVMCEG